MSSDRYTLAELHQRIAKDKDWQTDFRHLPKIRKAGLKFHVVDRNATSRKKLLIGYDKSNQKGRVYALLDFSEYGLFSLVHVRLSDDTKVGINQAPKSLDALLLQLINYVEPFDQLKTIGSSTWAKSLRYLVLYYFLEQGLIERCVFSNDGLWALKRACSSIANESTRMGNKTNRPKLVGPKNNKTADTQTQPSVDEDDSLEELNAERKALLAAPLKAPENPSLRGLGTMVQHDDDIAARVLSNTITGHLNLKAEHEPVPAVPMIACKPKRKKPASDNTTREDENQEREDPELEASRFNHAKRIVRDRVRLEIGSLEKEEAGVQDTLRTQTMSLDETLKSISSQEKALLNAKTRAKTEEAAKTASETRLKKVRNELTKKRVFEIDFDSYHT